MDASTVRMTFPYVLGTPLLAVNGSVTLLSGIISPQCTSSSTQTCNTALSSGNTVVATSPLNPVKPTVVINVPSTIGSCADLVIDASGSSGFGGRPWKSVSWALLTIPTDSTGLQQALNSQSIFQPYTIPAASLSQFQSFITLTLQLQNYLSQTSLAYALINLSDQPIPTVAIVGLTSLQVLPSNPVLISATATAPSCVSAPMTYQWSVEVASTGAVVTFPSSVRTDRVTLNLPSYSLVAGQTYSLTFSAYLNGASASTTASVVVPQDIVLAVIAGGSNQQVSSSLPLTLDASGSLDKSLSPTLPQNLKFLWTCVIADVGANYLQPCGFSLSSTAQVKIPANTFNAQTTYNFEVTVTTSDGRSSYADVFVSALGIPATVVINPVLDNKQQITSIINSNKQLQITCLISSDVSAQVSWSVNGNPSFITPSMALSPVSQSLSAPIIQVSFPLTIASDVFTPGSSYTFRLTVLPNGQSSGIYSEITLAIRFPPSSGSLSVSPSSGIALSTLFQFTATGWSAGDVSDLPLSYSVSTISPYIMTIESNSLSSSVSSYLSATASSSSSATKVIAQLVVSGSTGSVASPVITTVTVTPNAGIASNTSALSSLFNGQVSKALAASDPQAVARAVGLIASTLAPVTNCSTPVKCASLNRNDCSATAFTCGKCLPGYDGGAGLPDDYNGLCLKSSRRLASVEFDAAVTGSQCSSNYDCQFGACVNGVCASPYNIYKQCPSGCSGNGHCNYVGLVTGFLVPRCSVVDSSCVAMCQCSAGYAGLDCSVTHSAALAKSKLRGQLCKVIGNSVALVDTTATVVSGLNQAFQYSEVSNLTDISTCASALQTIVTKVNSKLSVQTDTQTLADIVSGFLYNSKLYGSSYGNSPVGLVMTNTVNTIAKSLLYGMSGGEYPKTVTSSGLALSVKTVSTVSLHGSSISVGSSLPTFQQSIILPPTGLDTCGYGTYAQYAVVEWVGNQFDYMSKKPILNEVLQFVAMSSKKYPKQAATPGKNPFQLVLKFAQPQNWSSFVPDCSLIGYGFQGSCSCRLTRYNAFNVTFTCPDVSTLCSATGTSGPSSAGSDYSVNVSTVSNFGVTMGDLTPTSVPTNLPSSSAPSIRPSSRPTAPTSFPTVKGTAKVNSAAVAAQTVDRASGTSFFTIYLFTAFVGLLVFWLWDYFERRTFNTNKERAANTFNLASATIATRDAFTTAGVDSLSMVSFKQRQNDPLATIGTIPQTVEKTRTTEEGGETFWKKLMHPIPLVAETSWIRFLQALIRHHSAIRHFSYGSLRLSRALRYFCFMTDMLIILFMDTAFYALAFPNQNNCRSYTTSSSCLNDKSYWTDDSHLCTWSGSNCDVRNPSGGFGFYLAIVLVIIVVSLIPLSGITWVFEYVFSKEPLWGKPDEEDEEVNAEGEEEGGNNDVKKGFGKTKEVLKEINLLPECDDHLKNRHLLQHYISEKVESDNKLLGFFLRKHFFVLDSATPNTINIAYLLATLITTVALWIFFIVYIYNWVTSSSISLVYSWGVTFIFTWLVQIFIVEVVGIFLVYVLPVNLAITRLAGIAQELETDKDAETTEVAVPPTDLAPDDGTGVRRDFAASRANRPQSSLLTFDDIYPESSEQGAARGMDSAEPMMSPIAPPNVVASLFPFRVPVDTSAGVAAHESEDLSPEADDIAGNSDEDEWYAAETEGRKAGI